MSSCWFPNGPWSSLWNLRSKGPSRSFSFTLKWKKKKKYQSPGFLVDILWLPPFHLIPIDVSKGVAVDYYMSNNSPHGARQSYLHLMWLTLKSQKWAVWGATAFVMSEMPEPPQYRIQPALIPFLHPRRDLIARRRKICWSSERQSQKNQSKVKCQLSGFQWNLFLVILLTGLFRMFKAWEKLALFEVWQWEVWCVLGAFAVFLLHIGPYYFFHYLCADWSSMLWANM